MTQKRDTSDAKAPDDKCPYHMCDGSGRIEEEDGFVTKCLCLIEKEAEEQYDLSKGN